MVSTEAAADAASMAVPMFSPIAPWSVLITRPAASPAVGAITTAPLGIAAAAVTSTGPQMTTRISSPSVVASSMATPNFPASVSTTGSQYPSDSIWTTSPWFEFSVEYIRGENKIFVRQKEELKRSVISAEDYPGFKDFLERAAKKVKQRIVLEKIKDAKR